MERAGQTHFTAAASNPGARRTWRWLALTGVSVLGSADIAQFVASNQGMLTSAPGRAAGSVLGLVLWLALTALGLRGLLAAPSPALRRGTVAAAAVVAAGSVGLAGIHAAAHVGGLRPGLGAVLGLGALGLAVVAVRS
ncbi:MAG: hypothetical protein ACREN7_01750 [Candidatus Dormibacteria bacterium]